MLTIMTLGAILLASRCFGMALAPTSWPISNTTATMLAASHDVEPIAGQPKRSTQWFQSWRSCRTASRSVLLPSPCLSLTMCRARERAATGVSSNKQKAKRRNGPTRGGGKQDWRGREVRFVSHDVCVWGGWVSVPDEFKRFPRACLRPVIRSPSAALP